MGVAYVLSRRSRDRAVRLALPSCFSRFCTVATAQLRKIGKLAKPRIFRRFFQSLRHERLRIYFKTRRNGFFKDRRLRADGPIIRAQATIRTDGFSVRAGLANTCALRAPTSVSVRIHTIRTETEVLQIKTNVHALTAAKVDFETRS